VAVGRYLSIELGERVFLRVRTDAFRSIINVSLRFVESVGSGRLAARFIRDVDRLEECVRYAIPNTLVSAATCIALLVAVAVTSPGLALSYLLIVPLVAIPTWRFLKRASATYHQESSACSGCTGCGIGFSPTVS
jgi:ABC-type multidrug transport system fused ATPase/permease subunit